MKQSTNFDYTFSHYTDMSVTDVRRLRIAYSHRMVINELLSVASDNLRAIK